MQAGIDYIGITTPFYCNDGKGNFVLHKRSTNTRDEHGRWDFGGGKVEWGETLQEAVLREVQEEYGVQGTIQEQLPPHSLFREHQGKKTHWVIIPFFVLIDPTKITIMEPHKVDELGIFPLHQLPSPLHSGISYALDLYHTQFAKYRFSS